MQSRVAEEARRSHAELDALLSPEQRIAKALAMGERLLELMMAGASIDRAEAVRRMRETGRAGRKASRAAIE